MISIILWTVVIGALINCLFAALFLRRIHSEDCPALDESLQELAVIVLPIRGCDPRLERTIQALLNQQFRDYKLLVVVDHKSDPAWSKLQEMKIRLDISNRMKIVPLENARSTCSLKCSALIQAVHMLRPNTRWVAFVDADVVVYPTWLADILGPLADDQVAVVSGSQWFEPSQPAAIGSMIRSIWNAGAIVPTVLLNHPWAGSMAMRYEDLITSSLLDDWKTTIVDDGPIAKFAKQMGGRIVMNPKLLMVNRESCSSTFAVNWIARMLTWSRIFEPTFPVTVLHAFLSAFLAIAIDVCLIWAVLSMDVTLIINAVAAVLGSAALCVMGFALARSAVSSSLLKRGQKPLPPLDFEVMKNVALLMGPVQLCYLWGCLRAWTTKVVSWRGVEYEIDGRSTRLIEYRPWQPEKNPTAANDSL